MIVVVLKNLPFDANSPATCNRILTISRGLVNMTWDAPAYKKHEMALGIIPMTSFGVRGTHASSGNHLCINRYVSVVV